MNGTDFIEMCRQDIETHKDKEILSVFLQAVKAVIQETPNCEIDPKRSALVDKR